MSERPRAGYRQTMGSLTAGRDTRPAAVRSLSSERFAVRGEVRPGAEGARSGEA